ncbi:kinesin motor domain-containing protein, partial [Gorgonomyces haynaldii]
MLGQTSSGKTHTMLGNQQEPGMTLMAIKQIFEHIRECPAREYLLRVSYMEIYNEVINDLLNPQNENLKIHENPNREIFVGKLTEEIVTSADDVQRLLSFGEGNRQIGDTQMNEKSSRSHTIFRLTIESREKDESARTSFTGSVNVSQLNLVDLAGSERAQHTGAEGKRLKEGGHINKSLLALTTVIAKLSEGDNGHIPYRDSKLTRILQPSLGGNAQTGIVCTITPANLHIDESLSTIRFASRARNIKNKPIVNAI